MPLVAPSQLSSCGRHRRHGALCCYIRGNASCLGRFPLRLPEHASHVAIGVQSQVSSVFLRRVLSFEGLGNVSDGCRAGSASQRQSPSRRQWTADWSPFVFVAVDKEFRKSFRRQDWQQHLELDHSKYFTLFSAPQSTNQLGRLVVYHPGKSLAVQFSSLWTSEEENKVKSRPVLFTLGQGRGEQSQEQTCPQATGSEENQLHGPHGLEWVRPSGSDSIFTAKQLFCSMTARMAPTNLAFESCTVQQP